MESGWVFYGPENDYSFPYPRLLRGKVMEKSTFFKNWRPIRGPMSFAAKGKKEVNTKSTQTNASHCPTETISGTVTVVLKGERKRSEEGMIQKRPTKVQRQQVEARVNPWSPDGPYTWRQNPVCISTPSLRC